MRLRDYHIGDHRGKWRERGREWAEFWGARGSKEKLDNRRRGAVNGVHNLPYRQGPVVDHLPPASREHMVDFVLKNPLQVDVELTDLTVVVKEARKTQTNEPQEGFVEVEEIDKGSLAPGEQRTVSGFLYTTPLVLILLARSQSPSDPFGRLKMW